ncbi:putative MFS family arabinose efflux permease [Paucimonas lemoignei]|uniref:Putative MFS family arabinose efflux permease n=1 Tax=Paucimonas lemoignei TaxID=29443 RepID=A0A4R3I113_PAULE|nr:MFS transporter [Paucimonas lemoignei]TCS38381.1 putative MFS family arabinose efflux permease [Paucimonas lemoignei]
MNSRSPDASSDSIPSTAILALSLAAFASAISLRLTDALLPRLANEFHVSLGMASYVITCFAVAYGVSQLFFGPVGDRYGKYRVIAWACIACAITAAMCALAPTYGLLLAARLFAGATAAAIIPLAMAWIGDVIPYENRQPVLARFLIGQILGVSAGVLVGGFTADHLSWRVPFWGVAMGFGLISMILLSLSRRLPAHAQTMHKVEGHAVQRMLSEFGQVLSVPWARVVLLTVFLEGACLYGAFAFIASHLHHVHGISLSKAGSLVMLFGFGGFLFATTAAVLVKRLGEVGLARWGGVLVCTSFATVGLAPAWQWAIPACFIAGLGFYMLHNTLQINATQMAPERRGAAVSAFASCFFLGQSAGVAAAGLTVEHVGTSMILVFGAFGVLAAALNFSRLRQQALRQTVQEQL